MTEKPPKCVKESVRSQRFNLGVNMNRVPMKGRWGSRENPAISNSKGCIILVSANTCTHKNVQTTLLFRCHPSEMDTIFSHTLITICSFFTILISFIPPTAKLSIQPLYGTLAPPIGVNPNLHHSSWRFLSPISLPTAFCNFRNSA